MEKYDISKPIKLPVGMHKLNDDPGISFQLNRLVNMDGCDLSVAREIGPGNMRGFHGGRDGYRVPRAERDTDLFHGVPADGRQPADVVLFAVRPESQEIPVHFAAAQRYIEQRSYPDVPADVWRRQSLARDACRGNGRAGRQHIICQDRKIHESGQGLAHFLAEHMLSL